MSSAVSVAPMYELWSYCPQLACGQRVTPGAATRPCEHCGAIFKVCPKCQATNRLLVEFCRGCGRRLEADAWPMQAGLRAARDKQQPITALKTLNSLKLGQAVLAAPIAADGMIVVAQAEGDVILLSEHNQAKIQIPVAGPLACTPALHAGMLFVAGKKTVSAFDLLELFTRSAETNINPFWTFDSQGALITQPLLVDNTALYVLSQSGGQATLEARSQLNGQALWTNPLSFDTQKTLPPVLANNCIVLATAEGDVHLIDPATAQSETYKSGLNFDAQVTPFVTGARVLMADSNGYLYEFVADRNRPLFNPLYDHRPRINSIAANEDYIAIGHMAGLTLLNARGQQRWANSDIESVPVSPLLAGDSLFVLNDRGNGFLFNALTANPVNTMKLFGGQVATPPLLTQKKIVAVSAAGEVALLDRD